MSQLPTTPPEPEFSWHAHPAAERAGAAAGASAAIAGLAAATGLSFGAGWGAAAAVVLVLSLRRFYFPTSYAIDGQGIRARSALGTRRLRWADVRRFLVDRNGGYLSTRSRRSWLDAYRGLHVLFGPRPDEVIGRIRAHVAVAGAGDAAAPAGAARTADSAPASGTGSPSWAR